MLKLKLPEWVKIKSVKKEPNLYRKCNELPIHNFNEVSNNNDLSYLKIDKKDVVSDIDLENAWLEILNEYLTISKNKDTFNLLNNQSNILLLETKLKVFLCLKNCIDNKIEVEEYLLDYKIKAENIDQHIGLIRNDLEKFKKEIPQNQKSNSNSFEETIAVILENGYQINRFSMVVSEWVAILNRIQLKIQNQKSNEQY